MGRRQYRPSVCFKSGQALRWHVQNDHDHRRHIDRKVLEYFRQGPVAACRGADDDQVVDSMFVPSPEAELACPWRSSRSLDVNVDFCMRPLPACLNFCGR